MRRREPRADCPGQPEIGAFGRGLGEVGDGQLGHLARLHRGDRLHHRVRIGAALGLSLGTQRLAVGAIDGGRRLVLAQPLVQPLPSADEARNGEPAVEHALRQAGVLGRDAGEGGRGEGGRMELHHPLERDPHHAHPGRRPRLGRDPLDDLRDVVAGAPGVGELRAERRARPAEVHGDEVVAAVDQLARDRPLLVLRHQIAGLQVRELLLIHGGALGEPRDHKRAAVRRRVKHRRQRAVESPTALRGVQHVDGDAAAVLHRNVNRLPLVPVRDGGD